MRLILLDRDGVLNEDRPDYVKSPGELVMIPGAAAAVARLNRAGLKVALCTNQSCVGRGIITVERLERIHEHLRERLAHEGGRLDAIYFCPHAPWENCGCRKPAAGMLREALRRFGIDPADAAMIGDGLRDLQAAKAAGCARHLVRTGSGTKTQAEGVPHDVLPVAVHDDLAAAVATILDGKA
ncbi:MAG TPA: D-glycero-beta-D-manno-heptose 1,7-bisphosphate 7-phosphatase [Alphaproteobacteria bacterium]|nr:D-glycero-beta-D-manno-heptose 1,7-bisphosphate 7-phosphatase [Alphaproteobacteria bacterium]